MRIARIPALIAILALLAFPTLGSTQQTIPVNVRYDYDDDIKPGCVTKIVVEVPNHNDPASPKDVVIWKEQHSSQKRTVVWELKPYGQESEGVAWSIDHVGEGHNYCASHISFFNGKAPCTPTLQPNGDMSADNYWEYKVEAVKYGCPTVAPDPRIIFRGGGGVNLLMTVTYVLLGLAVLLIFVWLVKRRLRTQSP